MQDAQQHREVHNA